MSQLSNNTTALQAILEAVEALPEAGGVKAELKSASGTYSPSADSSALSVTGMDFDPYILVVREAMGANIYSGMTVGAGTPAGGWCGGMSSMTPMTYTHSTGQATLSSTTSTKPFVKAKSYTWYAYGV